MVSQLRIVDDARPRGAIDSHLDHTSTRKETAAAGIVDVICAAGIDYIFGIPGGPISPVLDALLDVPNLHFVSCQHESMGVYAAIGYARATGRTGVVAVTSGPGVLSALTGLSSALLDEAPVLLLVGEVSTQARGRYALQDGTVFGLDIGNVTSSLSKRTVSIERAWSARATVEGALRATRQQPMGPVVVRIPVDIARSETRQSDVRLAASRRGEGPALPASRRPRTSVPESGHPNAPRQNAPPNESRTAEPLEATIQPVARYLAQASRNAIMLGGRARRTGCGPSALRLAERLQCRVFTDLEAKGLFPESHPLSLGVFGLGSDGRAEAYLSAGVDNLMLVGARLDDTTTASWSRLLRPEQGRVIQMDVGMDRLARSYEVDVAIGGDLPDLLEALAEHVPVLRGEPQPLTLAPPPRPELAGPPFDPRVVPAALQRLLPANTVYTSDIGNHLVFTATAFRFDEPDRFYTSLGLGGMGSGIGVAIGLSMQARDHRVVCICGDGSIMMYGNEVTTAVRHGLPLTLVVFNDGQWGMPTHGEASVYGRSHAWTLPCLDMASYVRAMGAAYLRIERPEDFSLLAQPPALPLVVDVPIDPAIRAANPRVGVIRSRA